MQNVWELKCLVDDLADFLELCQCLLMFLYLNDKPQVYQSRIFIVGKGVGWSSDISTSKKKNLKRLLQNKYLLELLYHKRNTLIMTATDGSIFSKIFKTTTWKMLEDITFI